ncbi:MAG: hypothetical protein CMQ28_04465 [Gammaproteobacteria bacterium]|nr:hypothetical protein [Gammaproteobacteria bacterium]
MYIPRSILVLLVIIYLLFLASVDWINQPEGAWFRPFLVGFLIVVIASWAHREQNSDEL